MAFANNINRDMTSADARAVAGQESWSDIFPDDFDPDADPFDYLGDHRLYFDTHGQPHFVPGANPFSGPLAQVLERGEKDGILARKARGELEGIVRDTRSRYGEPKEWDHVVVGLSREDAAALGPEGVKEWARVVIRSMQDSPAGDGKRQMLVTPLHNDTDNPHLQFLMHRIPVNEDARTVGASYELSRNSEAASQMKQVNTALEAAGLPLINDFRMGAFSVSEDRAPSSEELDRGAERVREAGGVTPPDLTTGPVIQRERVTPEMRHLDAMLSDAVKRQKEAEAIATAAATAVAAAQHAKSALEQYETEVRTREAAEALAAERQTMIEATAAALDAERTEHGVTSQQLENETTIRHRVEGERDEQIQRAETAEALAAARAEEITERTAERDGLASELEAEKAETSALTERLTETTSALETTRTELSAAREATAAAEEVAARLRDDLEGVRRTLATVQAQQAEMATAMTRLTAELEAASTARAAAEAALSEERTAFGNQMREMTAALAAMQAPAAEITADSEAAAPVAVDRRRIVEAQWPAGTRIRRHRDGMTIGLPGGVTIRATGDACIHTGGPLTDAAIAAMVAHAQREGWVSMEITGTAEFRRRLGAAAEAAGIEVTNGPGRNNNGPSGPQGGPQGPSSGPGPSSPASGSVARAAPAPASPAPWRSVPPEQWTREQRREADHELKSRQERGQLAGVKLREFGESGHRSWKAKHPDAPTGGDPGTGPKPRQPE